MKKNAWPVLIPLYICTMIIFILVIIDSKTTWLDFRKKQTPSLFSGALISTGWGEVGYEAKLNESKMKKFPFRFRYLMEVPSDLLWAGYRDYTQMYFSVDAKETFPEVGRINLMADNGVTVSSRSCWKTMPRKTAPWACSFAVRDLKTLKGPGKIQSMSKSNNLLLQDAVEFSGLIPF